MFQRYTEKARRVIFFARFEASQYGSPHIESEHMLLGLLREDRPLIERFLAGANVQAVIRAEIEKHIEQRERISTSVEMPLSGDCKKALIKAAEEADRLGHQHVGTEHLLLGMLHGEGSLAGRILQERGLKLEAVREQLTKDLEPPRVKAAQVMGRVLGARPGVAFSKLAGFLAGLKWDKAEDLLLYFGENARFVDVNGRQWSREEIEKDFVGLFAPYAKKNAVHIIEQTLLDSGDVAIAIVLWRNAILASMERIWVHRMSVVLLREGEDWKIVLMQVTPVHPA